MRARISIRRGLWALIALVTLVALFYAEEDWRGARAWQTARAEYTKSGGSLDFAKLIPPAIPDAQNLGALPLFAQVLPSKDEPYPHPAALEKALRPPGESDAKFTLPSTAGWQSGERPDLNLLRQYVATAYAATFKGVTPPPSALAQFEAIYPVIAELRDAAASRPYCRFNVDYTTYPLGGRWNALFTSQLQLTKVMTIHAILALDAHQPDVALGDLRAIFILASGCRKDPSIIGGLVSVALGPISEEAVSEGLARHAWSDAQLVQMQEWLGMIDFLAAYQIAVRGEAATALLALHDKPDLQNRAAVVENYDPSNPKGFRIIHFYAPWPSGWMDDNRRKIIQLAMDCIASTDPKAHRVYPDRMRRLLEKRRSVAVLGRYAVPWNVYYFAATTGLPHMLSSCSRAQVWVDTSILACGLERYRLAHGNYPPTLNSLKPDDCPVIPTDVINGQPYHYRVRPDGSYRLYSIGWNERDDGGTLVFKTVSFTPIPQIDFDQGDWVWFGPK